MVLTIFLILAAAAALGCGIYLTVKIYLRFPSKKEELEQKYLAIFISCLLFTIVLMFSWYYAFYIGRDISHADILVTDMTRLTTAPLSDASFKANMTNLIANRLGDESSVNKARIFGNLNKSVIVDPINYVQSRQGRQRFNLNAAQARDLSRKFSAANYSTNQALVDDSSPQTGWDNSEPSFTNPAYGMEENKYGDEATNPFR